MALQNPKSSSGMDQAQRVKVIALVVLTSILVIFAGYNLMRMLTPPPRAVEPQSPAWTLVRELNEALVARPAFHDTSLSVETDSPIKLKVHGQVKTQADFAALKAFIKETKPELTDEQLDYSEVVVLR